MGHMSAHSHEIALPYWDINKKDQKIFEVKKLGISFNAETLHGQQFRFSHIGGLTTLLEILDFLAVDVKQRLS